MGRVFQVVGYQNSGKTTFVVDYIEEAVKQGLKVGTIKHHGHHGDITLDDKQKDTGKHRAAGASVSLVEGNGSFALMSEKLSLSLPQMISLYQKFDLDIIVVEGFKTAIYPKVVLIRSHKDIPIINELQNLCCIVTNIQLPKDVTETYRIFNTNKESVEWLLSNKVGEVSE